MLRALLLSIAILLTTGLSAQNFVWGTGLTNTNSEFDLEVTHDHLNRTVIGGHFRNDLDLDSLSGSGNLVSGTSFDFHGFVALYDASGLLWDHALGGTGDDRVYDVASDAAGFIYAAGSFEDTVDFDPDTTSVMQHVAGQWEDAFVVCFDNSGQASWSFSLEGTSSEWITNLAIDNDGDLWVLGTYLDSVDLDPGPGTFIAATAGGGGFHHFLAQYDNAGNFINGINLGWVDSKLVNTLMVSPTNQIYLSGQFFASDDFDPDPNTTQILAGSQYDSFVWKFNQQAQYDTAWNIGGADDQFGGYMGMDALGNIFLAGVFEGSTSDFDPGPGTANLVSAGIRDLFLASYDSLMNFNWALKAGNSFDMSVGGLAVDALGNAYVTGDYFNSIQFGANPATSTLVQNGSSFNDCFMVKYNANGSHVWGLTLGGSGADLGYDIEADHEGDVHIAGRFKGLFDMDPSAAEASWWSPPGEVALFAAKYTSNCLPSAGTGTAGICPGDSLLLGGQWRTTAGVYDDTLVNAQGCDSINSTTLTFFATDSASSTVGICMGDSLFLGGAWQSVPGTFTDQYNNVNGCDSIHATTLIFLLSDSVTTTASICPGDSILLGGAWQHFPGTYTDDYSNANGCDSTVSTTLTIFQVDATVTQSGATLAAPQSDSYQWISCSTGMPVVGATGQTQFISGPDSFAVVVSQNGCVDTSACFHVSLMGLNEWQSSGEIQLVPNPTAGYVHVITQETVQAVAVYNQMGQRVLAQPVVGAGQSIRLDLSTQPAGVYFVSLQLRGGHIRQDRLVLLK